MRAQVEDWVAEKSKASDDNYTMASSLRAKLQWHENFQAELDTNATRVLEVICVCNRVVNDCLSMSGGLCVCDHVAVFVHV